jgi:wyosine [tRNA(Phe)-imidazoG37] synthetase (radical SAM superfamily)
MTTERLHTLHQRNFESNRFVYPVLSRRSQGMSIGVNLNPDKICNFDCIYCQVDRTTQSETRFVELAQLLAELDEMLGLISTGKIYETERFKSVPPNLRRLNDVAFSGDGEPTTYKNFDEIVELCAELKSKHELDETKMVLITNASMFHRQPVKRGLEVLDQNQGEVWAKLEAGTEEYFKIVDRTPIPFQQILDNITSASKIRPLVIQSLFMRIDTAPPSGEELGQYCERLNEIQSVGGQIKLVQIYTIARRPTESYVHMLEDSEVDQIVDLVRQSTGLETIAFYGSSDY